MLDFTNRVAVVTGGGSGIGAACCTQLAAAGAEVWVTDVRPEAAQEVADRIVADGGKAHAAELDVTNQAQCVEVTERVLGESGSVDALICSAGWAETHPFIDEDDAYWRKVVDINYMGVVYACHAVLRPMVDAGYGRIVTIASDAGRVGTLGETVYAGAKAGVMGFTKSLAREGARYGILANCVSPGVTDTPLMRHQDQKVIDRMVRLVPLKRLGKPEEVAAAAVFLASEEAAFVTGQVLSASGGLTMVG